MKLLQSPQAGTKKVMLVMMRNGHASRCSSLYFLLILYLLFVTPKYGSFLHRKRLSSKQFDLLRSKVCQIENFIDSATACGHRLKCTTLTRKGFLNRGIVYYANGTATFNPELLEITRSGDVHPHPGPETKTKCSSCSRTIARNHRRVTCNACKQCFHFKCGGVSLTIYKKIISGLFGDWTCPECTDSIQGVFNFSESFYEDLTQSSSQLMPQDESSTDTISQPIIVDSSELEQLRKTAAKDLMIAHLNINSIQNKFEELRGLMKKMNIHIMIVTETKIDASYPDAQFSVPHYSLYRNDRKKGGGGILALISTTISVKRLKLKNYKTLEPLAFEIKTSENDNMVIIGIYRPPRPLHGDYKLLLESELSDICNCVSLQSNTIVVLGDLNLDRLQPNKPECKLLRDIEDEQCLDCLITEPTRIANAGTITTKSLIDVLLCNKPELFSRTGTYQPCLSDHALIYGILNHKVNLNKPKIINFRSYKNFDNEGYKEALDTAPWHITNLFDDIDDKVYAWNLLMHNVLDEFAPQKTMKVRDIDVPYMTTEWKTAIRAKRKAMNKYLKDKTPENWELRCKTRNEATRQRRLAIKNHWTKKVNDLKNNPRNFYNTFKPYLNTKTKVGCQQIHLKSDEHIIKDQSLVANLLVDHFATIADGIGGDAAKYKEIDDFINHSSVKQISEKQHDQEQSIPIVPVTQKQVLAELESLNTRKATGSDNIPAKALRLGAKELSEPLTTLFNSCINKSIWPSVWKKGDWTPVFKKDDKLLKENYRPITTLPCINKMLEKLVAKQITESFAQNMYTNSNAYRKHHSCETTLINLIEAWKKARDDKQVIDILSTDMSKAFDSLHPPLLLSKLKAYGFNENAIQLLKSYLSGRYNRVKIGNEKSSYRLVERGCPQGSALGPLLWNIFQNDLPQFITAEVSMYADDHQIYHTGENQTVVTTALKDSAGRATKWYEDNLLAGNLDKYRRLNIGYKEANPNDNINYDVCVKDKIIKNEDSLKLLGVTIDSKLNFSEHIKNICIKASQRVGVLMRLRNMIPTNAKLQLYKTSILPYLTYCHLVWHSCKASDTRKLERVQERALRAIFRNKQSNYHELLKRANLQTLANRRLQDICILMYKVKNGLCPTNIANIFNNHKSSYNLRHKDFQLPSFKTVKYGKHSIKYLGPKLWSKLSAKIRESCSLGAFKRQIRKMNLTGDLYSSCKDCKLCNE